MSPEERFWNRVKIGDPNSCWEWQGKTIKDGYGAFHFQGKRVIASRFVWILTYGEIPKGMYVLHKCDNPSCVNPRHLFLGTQKDNMRDASLKLRKSGPHNGRTKLSWPQVDTIRILLERGWSTCCLAKLFGVNYKTVWQIREGKTWREPKEVMLQAYKNEEAKESALEPEGKEVMLKEPKEEENGEAKNFEFWEPEGEANFQKEEYEMKSKGIWFITERVRTPALTLEFPVALFHSREAALGFIKGKEKNYRLRFVLSDLPDLGRVRVLEKEALVIEGEAASNSKKERL